MSSEASLESPHQWLWPDHFQVTLLSFLVDIEVTFLDYIKGGWVNDHAFIERTVSEGVCSPLMRSDTLSAPVPVSITTPSWLRVCNTPKIMIPVWVNQAEKSLHLHVREGQWRQAAREREREWQMGRPEVKFTGLRLWSVFVCLCPCLSSCIVFQHSPIPCVVVRLHMRVSVCVYLACAQMLLRRVDRVQPGMARILAYALCLH